jgi:uncharacterized protein (DUF58 family)
VFGDNEHHEIKPRRSKQSLLQLLNRLVQGQPEPAHRSRATDASAWPCRAREVLRPGSLVIVICDERALTEAPNSNWPAVAPLRPAAAAGVRPTGPCPARRRAAALRPAWRTAGTRHPDADLRQAYRPRPKPASPAGNCSRKAARGADALSTQSEMVEQLREYLNPQRPGSVMNRSTNCNR